MSSNPWITGVETIKRQTIGYVRLYDCRPKSGLSCKPALYVTTALKRHMRHFWGYNKWTLLTYLLTGLIFQRCSVASVCRSSFAWTCRLLPTEPFTLKQPCSLWSANHCPSKLVTVRLSLFCTSSFCFISVGRILIFLNCRITELGGEFVDII